MLSSNVERNLWCLSPAPFPSPFLASSQFPLLTRPEPCTYSPLRSSTSSPYCPPPEPRRNPEAAGVQLRHGAVRPSHPPSPTWYPGAGVKRGRGIQGEFYRGEVTRDGVYRGEISRHAVSSGTLSMDAVSRVEYPGSGVTNGDGSRDQTARVRCPAVMTRVSGALTKKNNGE